MGKHAYMTYRNIPKYWDTKSIGTPLQFVKIRIFRHPKNWDISKIAKIFGNFLYHVPYELGQCIWVKKKKNLVNRVKLFSQFVLFTSDVTQYFMFKHTTGGSCSRLVRK